MHVNARFVSILAFLGILSIVPSSIHAQQLPDNYQDLELYDLDRAIDALEGTGFTAADRADAFVSWMAVHDWRSLDINSLYNLFIWISADAVNPRQFSARWTGSITAPVTGPYTLRQVRQYATDSHIKVIVGGQTVLDSSGDSSDQDRFISRPVQLTAGQAVPIQVDLVHHITRSPPIYDFSADSPMVFLTWRTNQGTERIIPASAFTPPPEFAEEGANGLKGQYFGNTEFEDLRVTRLDAALDLVWSWPPVAPIHQSEAGDVFAACKAKILDAAFLAHCAEHRQKILSYHMWRIAYRMTATERQQLVSILRNNPAVLAAMSPGAMGRLTQGIYILPDDSNVELIGEWAMARPQPHTVAGVFPGWGSGYYQIANTDYYWLMGRFMQGPYASDAELLCDQFLARPDGSCNLAVAYAAAYASRLNRASDEFISKLDEQINDESTVGDKLATWLIARAFAQGAIPGNPQPLAGFSDLESAYVAAEENSNKFWALQEMVARLSSVDKGEQAKALIEERRGRFNSPQQQAAMAKWITKADQLAVVYDRKRAAQAKATNTAYRSELERRRQAAIERGDTAAADRFAELISSAQAALEE